MQTLSFYRVAVVAAATALLILNPAFARGGDGGGGGRGGFTGRGFSTPRANSALSGRGNAAPRGGGRSPGSVDRGPRNNDGPAGMGRTAGLGTGRRGPRDRPDWDGRVPGGKHHGRDHDHGHGHGHGHGPGWWARRPYWGYGFGGYFYDPFYSPFYSYGAYDDDGDRNQAEEENIEVRVKPDDAQIYVNGLLYSNRGKARFTLPSGPWTVEIRAPGYQTERIELNVEQGKRYKIERKLRRDETFNRDGKPLKTEELNH